MKKMEMYLKFINNRLQKHVEMTTQLNQSVEIETLPGLTNEALKHPQDKIKRHLNHIKMRLEKSMQIKNIKKNEVSEMNVT